MPISGSCSSERVQGHLVTDRNQRASWLRDSTSIPPPMCGSRSIVTCTISWATVRSCASLGLCMRKFARRGYLASTARPATRSLALRSTSLLRVSIRTTTADGLVGRKCSTTGSSNWRLYSVPVVSYLPGNRIRAEKVPDVRDTPATRIFACGVSSGSGAPAKVPAL